MPLDIVLLLLRVAIAVALYVFMAALFRTLWNEMRMTSAQLEVGQKPLGTLTVLDGGDSDAETGIRYPLSSYTTLGRAPTNTIVVTDSFASNDHAHISQRAGQWWLEDKDSRNGTLLNDIPVSDAVVLTTGDVISIGRVRLRVEFA